MRRRLEYLIKNIPLYEPYMLNTRVKIASEKVVNTNTNALILFLLKSARNFVVNLKGFKAGLLGCMANLTLFECQKMT